MKRIVVTRKKFYDIRRVYKDLVKRGMSEYRPARRLYLFKEFNMSPTTLTRILKAHNFQEYKASGNVYGKGVKSLRKRYLFILGVLVVVLVLLNIK